MSLTANNPNRKSWIPVPNLSDFPIQNIPFGVFLTPENIITVGSRIGNKVIDLAAMQQLGYFDDIPLTDDIFLQDSLNDFIADGKKTWRAVRKRIADLFDADSKTLRDNRKHRHIILFDLNEVEMKLPVFPGDYTDFYSSKEHATNVGTMFRDPKNALLPNWLHLPVGYHGRSSTIVPSGVNVHRPVGQTKAKDQQNPIFGPSQRVDFELETAFITTDANAMGETVTIDEAEDYIFGMVLFNDWSARDLQTWEYVPLGPFLAKSFASSISPWVVTLDALEPFRVAGPKQNPLPLPYLRSEKPATFDINLELDLTPPAGKPNTICRTNFKYLYWSMAQQLAHHTSNGCRVNSGDIMGSGTISGPTPNSYGSMLELTWAGKNPIALDNGQERRFIEDGDTVTIRGFAEKDGLRIGFGEVKSTLLPVLKS